MARRRGGSKRWQAAMASSTTQQNYKDGILATTVNPMQLAASQDAEQRYLQAIQDAVNSGRRSAKLNAIPMQSWQGSASTTGATNLAAGAKKGAPKMDAHFQKFDPVYDSIAQAVAAMPKGGIDNALNRVRTTITMLKQAAGKAV